MTDFIKVKSRDGKAKRIASTSGHVFIVGKDFTEIPASMEQEAFMSGCVSQAVIDDLMSQEKQQVPGPVVESDMTERELAVIDEMKKIITEGKPEAFTNSGTPDKRVLAGRLGFAPTAEEFNRAWEFLLSSVEGDE